MSNKSKGSAFERVVAKAIADFLGVTNKEVFRSQPKSPFDQLHGDIHIPDNLKGKFPFCVEVKTESNTWTLEGFLNGTNTRYLDWAEQILDNVQGDDIPVVFFKKDRSPTFVYMPTCFCIAEYEHTETALLLPSGCGCVITEKLFFTITKDFKEDYFNVGCMFGHNASEYSNILEIKKHVRQTKKKKS